MKTLSTLTFLAVTSDLIGGIYVVIIAYFLYSAFKSGMEQG